MNKVKQQVQAPQAKAKSCEVSIRFGRMSMHCQNFGICRVELLTEVPSETNMFPAKLSYLNKVLRLDFQLNQIPKETLNKYFAKEIFLVQEDFELSHNCCHHLEVNTVLVKAGRYKIERNRTHLRILIGLSNI